MYHEPFPPIFDGHNDTITTLFVDRGRRGARSFFERNEQGHLDLPRAREGGLGGGFFAVSVSGRASRLANGREPSDTMASQLVPPEGTGSAASDEGSSPPAAVLLERMQSEALYWLGALFKLERESNGRCKIVRSASELRCCLDTGTFAIALHLEGAYPLDVDGHALEVFYQAGVRSVGLAHFRPSSFAVGVPRSFPHTPDTGPGLTEAGKELVRQCNRLRIMIDLSHGNEKTFWDVAQISDAPLVATHSNAWEMSHSPRNLTDKQLAAIRKSRGLVGLNFYVAMLRADGRRDPVTPLSVLLEHMDYMVDKVGIDCVGFGSDFDGAPIPNDLKDAAGLPKLMRALADRGYDDAALQKIAYGNWVRILHKVWGA